MTTSIVGRVLVARDLFAPNDVLVLRREEYPLVPTLAGIAWLRRAPPRSAHREALAVAVAALARLSPAYHLWLLGAHTVAQADSRISRHKRFWSSLEARGIAVPKGARIEGEPHPDQGGWRWFGAVPLSSEESAEAVAVVEAEPASLVVAVPGNVVDGIAGLVARGWACPRDSPPADVLEWLCPLGGIALRPVGAFDDIESGVVALSTPEVIARIAPFAH